MIRILLIDDDVLVSKSLKKLLEKQGYRVEVAQNAIEGITLAAKIDFNLVVSDIRMPGDNGVVAVQKIQDIYKSKSVPCRYIFISGYAEEDTPSHAIKLGVDKFLYKPFDNEQFLNIIREELEIFQQQVISRTLKHKPALVASEKPNIEKGLLKRVVITGIGIASPFGIGKEAYWQGLRDGRNGVDRISLFDCSAFPSKYAAEVRDLDPIRFIDDPHEIKRMGRSAHLAVCSSKLALKDSGLDTSNGLRADVFLGSATSGIDYAEPEIRALEKGGVRRVRPFAGIAAFGGAISGEVSRALKLNGSSITLSNGCTSSTDAMGIALRQVRFGLSKVVIAGGADACVTPAIVAAFCQMGAISTRNDRKASRPFNKDRDGFVIAEGGWVFVFEELEHALKRNARIYAELAGYGATCDAWHMSKPHPSGEFTSRAVQLSLLDADIEPEEVDIFEAYGNATPVNDSYETSIVKQVFGDHAYKLAMPSVKSLLGHPIGAAGGQQLAAALLALCEGYLHPTINYEIPDPECDLDCVPNIGRLGNYNVAVCNSLAFGGKNASIVLKKFKVSK
jgi:3-oxoacyl-[acyl-carrier-protein] synthase II